MNTLASLPGNAAELVQLSDWVNLSKSLPISRTEVQVHKLFYPSEPALQINPSAKRRRHFLSGYTNDGYWEVYQHVLLSPDLYFPDLHRVIRLSKDDGRILFLVMSHVVAWLNSNPTVITDRRDNNKPPLRNDLQPALQHFGEGQLRSAKRRLQVDVSFGVERSMVENASVMMQQEILEFVCDQLETFKSPEAKLYLEQMPQSDALSHYTARFSIHAWAGVRAIVFRYVPNTEQYQWLTYAPGLCSQTDFSKDGLKQVLDDIEGVIANSPLKSKIDYSALRHQLISWLSEQYHTHSQPQPKRPDEQEEATIHGSCTDVDANAAETTAPTANVATIMEHDIRETVTTWQNDTSSSQASCTLREDLASNSVDNAAPIVRDQQTSTRAITDKPEKRHAAGAPVQRRPLPAARVFQPDSGGLANSLLSDRPRGSRHQEKAKGVHIHLNTPVGKDVDQSLRPKASWRRGHKAS